MLRPLYYLCKIFGLASYSYVADRRNKRATADCGYWNCMINVIRLIVCTVGLPVRILTLSSDDFDSQTLLIAFMVSVISSYTSSIVAVVWVSVIKRRKILDTLENSSEVENKIRYTLQEETSMNIRVIFNIISEIILLTFIQCTVIVYNIHQNASEPYYITITATIDYVPDICNALVLFKFGNIVIMMKQRYSHPKKRLNYWINCAVIRPICLNKQKERCNQTDRAFDQVHITSLYVSSVRNLVGTLKQTDIHCLRQIYSELYDITCLINDIYGIPVLVTVCSVLTRVVFCLCEALICFKKWAGEDLTHSIAFMVLFFKVTFFCHTTTNEAMSSRILVEKLLLEGKFRNECVKELKMFSLQLQAMKI